MKMNPWFEFADFAALPFVGEGAGGELQLNEAARQLMGPRVGDWLAILQFLLRLPTESLAEMLDAARQGQTVLAPSKQQSSHSSWRLRLSSGESGLTLLAWPADVEISAAMQRRAAAADLVAGVSHEVANALGAVIGWTQLAQMQTEPSAVRQALDRIEASAQAAHAAARLMLQSVRHEQAQHELLEVSAVLSDVARLLKAEAQLHRVRVEVDAATPQWIFGARPQLFTVVWNLAQNAVQAIAENQRLPAAANLVVLRLEAQGKRVRLIVEDDGPGIDAAQRERIFEPYFTTRAQGTGLGLALVQGTVRELQGDIEVQARSSGGTRFVVDLPRVQRRRSKRQVERSTAAASESPLRRPAESIETTQELTGLRLLIVDDDAGVRELLSTLLSIYGADVTAVESAAQACAVTPSYDLACIDLSLGDERGDVLLARLRRSGIVQHAVLVSGASIPHDLDVDGRPQHWLRKPFEPRDLVALIRETLGKR